MKLKAQGTPMVINMKHNKTIEGYRYYLTGDAPLYTCACATGKGCSLVPHHCPISQYY